MQFIPLCHGFIPLLIPLSRFIPLRHGGWRSEQHSTKLMQYIDSNNKVWKWNYNCFIVFKLLYACGTCICLGIALETPVFWLGSFLIVGQKLISRNVAVRMYPCARMSWSHGEGASGSILDARVAVLSPVRLLLHSPRSDIHVTSK